MHIDIYPSTYIYIYTCTFFLLSTDSNLLLYIYIHTYIHTQTHIYVCIHLYKHVYIHIYIYIYIYIYVYTCTFFLLSTDSNLLLGRTLGEECWLCPLGPIYMYLCLKICIYINIYVCMYVYVYICIYIYIHIYMVGEVLTLTSWN
jgi:hypothetical protein